MNNEQKQTAVLLAENTPKSLWSYWILAFPLLVILFGVGLQVVCVAVIQAQVPEAQLLIRSGERIIPFGESSHVWNVFKANVMMFGLMAGFLALLSVREFRVRKLLRASVIELELLPNRDDEE